MFVEYWFDFWIDRIVVLNGFKSITEVKVKETPSYKTITVQSDFCVFELGRTKQCKHDFTFAVYYYCR